MSYACKDFEKDVIERSYTVPVVVDFWADWCGPCRALGPVLERLAAAAGGSWELVKVDTEAFPEVAARHAVRSIPSVKLFDGGEVVDEFVGALPEAQVKTWLARVLPSAQVADLARARGLVATGQGDEAATLLQPLTALGGDDGDEARVLLAGLLFPSEPARVIELLEPVDAFSRQADQAGALRTMASLAQVPEHPETLPEAKVRERYLDAARHLRAGDYAGAVEGFIDVLVRKRDYADGGAQEACKSIFRVLGNEHPVTQEYSRSFSSALFA